MFKTNGDDNKLFTPNSITNETKAKFDALLKEALNKTGPTNPKTSRNNQNVTKSTQNLISESESSISSFEDKNVVENPNDIKDSIKNETEKNFILDKFLRDSVTLNEDSATVLSDDAPITFIKPPVPKPRRIKTKPNTDLQSVSSVGTYKIPSHINARGENNKRNNLNATSHQLINIADSTSTESISKLNSKNAHIQIPASDILVHKSPTKELNLFNKQLSEICDQDNKTSSESKESSGGIKKHNVIQEFENDSQSDISNSINVIKNVIHQKNVIQKLNADEIEYENEISPKHKSKQKHKTVEDNLRLRDVDEKKYIEKESVNVKYSYEKITGIAIHKTDRLKLDSLVIHPVVKIHIVNSATGEYLTKSDKERSVTYFYESKDIPYIVPVMTEPFNLQKKRSLYPAWEETLIVNEDFQYVLENDYKTIIFFEIMDFVSFSVANSQFLQQGTSRGWHKIAWAFLKPLGKNNALNVNKRVRLQLYYPNKHKKDNVQKCYMFDWWFNKKLNKYPSTLYITIKSVIPPEKVVETLRSKTPIHGERATNIILETSGGDAAKNKKGQFLSQKIDVIQDNSEFNWSDLKYQSSKLPNKCIAQLSSYDDGCLILKFSNSGLYLACAVLIDQVYTTIIYSVENFEEVSKFPGHQGLIYNITWSKDDKILISASADGTVCIWDFKKQIFNQMLPHPSYIYATDINSENVIATGCYDNIVRIWGATTDCETSSFKLIQELEKHKGFITSACFTSKGDILYTSDSIGVIIEWKESTKTSSWSLRREIKLLDLCETIINQILLHKREKKLLIHARDSTLRLMDLKTTCVLQYFQGALNNRFQTYCTFSPCSSLILVGGENGLINVWNTDSGDTIATYTPYGSLLQHNLPVHCIQYHPTESIFAISHYGKNFGILLCSFDKSDDGSNLGLRVIQNDDVNKKSLFRCDKFKGSDKNVIDKSKNTTSDSKTKVNFENIIRKLDDVIIFTKNSTTSNNCINTS